MYYLRDNAYIIPVYRLVGDSMANKMRRIGKALARPFVAMGRGMAKGVRMATGRELTARQKQLAFESKIKRKGTVIQIPTSFHSAGAMRSYREESTGRETEHSLIGTGGFQLQKRDYSRVVEHHEGDEAWGKLPRTELTQYKKNPIRTRTYDASGKLVRETKHTKKGDKEWVYQPAGRFKGKRVRSPTK